MFAHVYLTAAAKLEIGKAGIVGLKDCKSKACSKIPTLLSVLPACYRRQMMPFVHQAKEKDAIHCTYQGAGLHLKRQGKHAEQGSHAIHVKGHVA